MDSEKKKVDLVKLASRCGKKQDLRRLLETTLRNDQEIAKLKKNPCLTVEKCEIDHVSDAIGLGGIGAILFFLWLSAAGLGVRWHIVLLIGSIASFVSAFRAKRRDQLKIHREAYDAKMEQLFATCLQRHVAAKVKLQRERLLGERGVFKQLGELFEVQLKTYGEPEEQPKQEVVSARPYQVPYEDQNAPAEPVRLPPELASLRYRYAEYFDAKGRELTTLCDEYLPRIVEMQDKAHSTDSSEAVRKAAATGAQRLEQEFFDKVSDILLYLDSTTWRGVKQLRDLFTGSDEDAFVKDLSYSRSRAKELMTGLMIPSAPLLQVRVATVSATPDEPFSDATAESAQGTASSA
ncbi:MAG: hypothetical protein PHS79_00655 [Patescibacteria group bacterium]|nr:hypothetical protein [Patescibacteria group bacterium]